MVVGSGMIAKALSRYAPDPEVTVFASGVSNSMETDPAAYARERKLLEPYLHQSATLVYFSTSSLDDPALKKSAYVQHKIAVEQHIAATAKRYLILRLPNVVGQTNNPHTIFNAFKKKLLQGEEITVFTKACRYLLDAEDLDMLLRLLLDADLPKGMVLNLSYNNRMSIPEMVHMMAEELGVTPRVKAVEKGGCYAVENKTITQVFTKAGKKIPGREINRELIRKYIS